MNLREAIKQELVETVAHFRELDKIVKEEGVIEALKYDWLATKLGNCPRAVSLRAQEKTRKFREVPISVGRDENGRITSVVWYDRFVTDAEYDVLTRDVGDHRDCYSKIPCDKLGVIRAVK